MSAANIARMTTNDAMDEVFNARNAPRGLDDTDRNRLDDLRHEACDWHCDDCGCCSYNMTSLHSSGHYTTEDVAHVTDGDGQYLCVDCIPIEGPPWAES